MGVTITTKVPEEVGLDRDLAIVVPAYNAEATLGRAIASVLAQDAPNWRLILVDDGSTDATAAIAGDHANTDSRISYVRLEHGGVAAARNVGIARAEGEYVAFLDADDELVPEYVRAMGDFVRRYPGYDIYHPNLTVVTADGARTPFSARTEVVSWGVNDLLEECRIPVGGAVVRRAMVQAVGGFRHGPCASDYDLWLRALSQGARALYLPVELYVYHLERSGRMSENVRAGAEAVIGTLAELVDEPAMPAHALPRIKEALHDRRVALTTPDVEEELVRQAVWYQDTLERWVGSRRAAVVSGAARPAARAVRPFRVAGAWMWIRLRLRARLVRQRAVREARRGE